MAEACRRRSRSRSRLGPPTPPLAATARVDRRPRSRRGHHPRGGTRTSSSSEQTTRRPSSSMTPISTSAMSRSGSPNRRPRRAASSACAADGTAIAIGSPPPTRTRGCSSAERCGWAGCVDEHAELRPGPDRVEADQEREIDSVHREDQGARAAVFDVDRAEENVRESARPVDPCDRCDAVPNVCAADADLAWPAADVVGQVVFLATPW